MAKFHVMKKVNAIHAKGKWYEVKLGGVNHEFEDGNMRTK
jgi:lipocalin